MLFQERVIKIMNLLEKFKTVSNRDLVKLLNASEATIRRDLNYLEKEKKIKRVRGGAILNKIEKKEISIEMKDNVEIEAKKYMAKIASNLIEDGDYIYLDAGTTTNQIIDFLKERNVKVVTNGIMHLEKLMSYKIESYLIGGKIKASTKAVVGVKAIDDLENYVFDKAFIGVNGIDEGGYTTHDIEEAILKKQAIKQAKTAYVLVDETKFNITYFSNIEKLENAIIITNKEDIDKNILRKTKVINK